MNVYRCRYRSHPLSARTYVIAESMLEALGKAPSAWGIGGVDDVTMALVSITDLGTLGARLPDIDLEVAP